VADLSLDRQAFILTRHDTKVRDFYDEERGSHGLLRRGRGADQT
jgi:hypothetical protein